MKQKLAFLEWEITNKMTLCPNQKLSPSLQEKNLKNLLWIFCTYIVINLN